jgi:Inositol polyphosphate kinase
MVATRLTQWEKNMATGGHGAISPGPSPGTLAKVTNSTERLFYETVFQGGAVQAAAYPPQVPPLALAQHLPAYHGCQGPAASPTIVFADISDGFGDARMMDVKIGKATVSKKELIASGMSAPAAWEKKRKLQIVDKYLHSAENHFRIIHFTGGPDSRTDTARADPGAMIDQFFGNSAPLLKQQAIALLVQLWTDFVNTPNVFCIAASVLFCYDAAAVAPVLRMKLIDFGHSYFAAPAGVNDAKYRNNFQSGLQYLRNYMV